MKVMWLIVAGLALVYVSIWAATKDHGPAPPSTQATEASANSQDTLVGIAKEDAASRAPSGAKIDVVSVTPKVFTGDDLKEAGLGAAGTRPGFAIVLDAMVADKAVARLTYHAAPPGTVVFVSQKSP